MQYFFFLLAIFMSFIVWHFLSHCLNCLVKWKGERKKSLVRLLTQLLYKITEENCEHVVENMSLPEYVCTNGSEPWLLGHCYQMWNVWRKSP